MDPAVLVFCISLVTVNMTMLGLVLRQMNTNGKPKKVGNPQAVDPSDIRLGDVSLAYFKEQFVTPIIKAIEDK